MRRWLRSYYFLLKWNLLRARGALPTYFVVQTMMSIGIVVGFSFLIPDATPQEALYLCTGSMTVSLITMGMVVVPQTVSYRKETGVLDFQRSMPVPRMVLMAADATVWVVIALPGLILATIVALYRFPLDLTTSVLIVPAITLVMIGTVAVGYSIAYLVKPIMVNLVTNVIMIVALMFAPINYPAERLPDWLASVHQWLPFQYMAQAIRESVDIPAGGVSVLPFAVLFAWCVIGLTVAARTLTRRQ